jgi:hypothetical protein
MSGNGILIKAGIVLVLLWAGVWGVSKYVSGLRPTPEKALTFVEENDLSKIEDPDERKQVLGDLADMLNAMEAAEVQEFQKMMFADAENPEAGRRQMFENLSPEEQWYFMERRIGRAFDQMMQAFNEMDREERKKVVERTLRQMRRDGGGNGPSLDRLEGQDQEFVEKVTSEGFRAYYEEANAETKLDLAPVLEEMQRNLGGGRGPR